MEVGCEVQRGEHRRRQVLPGFKWLSWRAFALGLVVSFLSGVYAGLVYVPVYNFLQRRWGA